MNTFYVYEHWRPDKDICFYVGKGKDHRAYYFNRKYNRHYDGIAKKLARLGMCIEVRMVASGMTEADAYDLEKYRIVFWREIGVVLANKSEGGRGGMSGCKRSPETRAKQSASTTGRKLTGSRLEKAIAVLKSPERRQAVKDFHTGRKRSKATCKNIAAGVKRSWADPAIRAKKLAAMPVQVVSEETRAKMRAAKTAEARAKIGAAVKKQWDNPAFRKLVSDTMKRTNAARRSVTCAG